MLPRVADFLGEAAQVLSDTSRLLDPAPDIVLEFAPLRQRLLGGKPERIAALGLILQDYGPVIARVRTPTLVVWGADDMVAPLRTGLMLADRLPDAQLVVFPGIGHQVMAQAPTKLVPEIERHLAATGTVRTQAVATATQGKGVCKGQSDLHLTGVYDTIEIEDCTRVTLDQVRTTSLVIRRSSASIIRSTFTAGITAETSTLIVTGGEIGGEVARGRQGQQGRSRGRRDRRARRAVPVGRAEPRPAVGLPGANARRRHRLSPRLRQGVGPVAGRLSRVGTTALRA